LTDQPLLRDCTKRRSEAAFAGLVRRQRELALLSGASDDARYFQTSVPVATVEQSHLFSRRFPAQIFLSDGVHANHFAVGDEKRHHDLEARFELRLLP
jgi:hypothetical protein